MLITSFMTAGDLPVLHGQDTVISLYEATTDCLVQPGSAPLPLQQQLLRLLQKTRLLPAFVLTVVTPRPEDC